MKTIDLNEIISNLFGLSKDAPKLTPIDKGECLAAMREACSQAIDMHFEDCNKHLDMICSTDSISEDVKATTKAKIK